MWLNPLAGPEVLHVSAAWLLRRCIRQGTHARGSMRAHQIRVKSCFQAIRVALGWDLVSGLENKAEARSGGWGKASSGKLLFFT